MGYIATLEAHPLKPILLLLATCSLMAFASDTTDIKVGDRFEIDSKIMGEKRTILVYLPENYDRNDTKYPVLYLTDGEGHMLHTSGTIDFLADNGRIPQMIVVGVTNTDRTRDLSPTPIPNSPTSGGADRFLQFFAKELIPQIEKRYRAQPYRVFAGHSLGGLFAVNAFLGNSGVFDAYIAVSPSLWWDNQLMIKRAETFMAAGKAKGTLFMTLGNEDAQMEEPYNAFRAILEKNPTPNFSWGSRRYEDEDHGSVVLRSHYDGLKKVFEAWNPPPDQNLKQLVEHFANLSKKMKYEIKAPENMINNLGYRLMAQSLLDEALEAFSWNVTNYPGSANVYDSYGEGLEKANRLEEARTHYEKAVHLGRLSQDNNLKIFQEHFDKVSAALKKTGT